MEINEIIKEVAKINIQNGWRDTEVPFAVRAMLVVTEISEAVEADRVGKRAPTDWQTDMPYLAYQDKLSPMQNLYFSQYVKDTVEDEIADTIIRLFDLSSAMGIDIESHIITKMLYNKERGFKHGDKAY